MHLKPLPSTSSAQREAAPSAGTDPQFAAAVAACWGAGSSKSSGTDSGGTGSLQCPMAEHASNEATSASGPGEDSLFGLYLKHRLTVKDRVWRPLSLLSLLCSPLWLQVASRRRPGAGSCWALLQHRTRLRTTGGAEQLGGTSAPCATMPCAHVSLSLPSPLHTGAAALQGRALARCMPGWGAQTQWRLQ